MISLTVRDLKVHVLPWEGGGNPPPPQSWWCFSERAVVERRDYLSVRRCAKTNEGQKVRPFNEKDRQVEVEECEDNAILVV